MICGAGTATPVPGTPSVDNPDRDFLWTDTGLTTGDTVLVRHTRRQRRRQWALVLSRWGGLRVRATYGGPLRPCPSAVRLTHTSRTTVVDLSWTPVAGGTVEYDTAA